MTSPWGREVRNLSAAILLNVLCFPGEKRIGEEEEERGPPALCKETLDGEEVRCEGRMGVRVGAFIPRAVVCQSGCMFNAREYIFLPCGGDSVPEALPKNGLKCKLFDEMTAGLPCCLAHQAVLPRFKPLFVFQISSHEQVGPLPCF